MLFRSTYTCYCGTDRAITWYVSRNTMVDNETLPQMITVGSIAHRISSGLHSPQSRCFSCGLAAVTLGQVVGGILWKLEIRNREFK